MLDVLPKGLGWSFSGERVDFAPSFRSCGQDMQHVLARYARSSGYDGSKALHIWRKGRQAMENASGLDCLSARGHFNSCSNGLVRSSRAPRFHYQSEDSSLIHGMNAAVSQIELVL
jgi:hypothetical protein